MVFRCVCSLLHLVEVSLSPKIVLSSSADTFRSFFDTVRPSDRPSLVCAFRPSNNEFLKEDLSFEVLDASVGPTR
jgi:hypothetical protein